MPAPVVEKRMNQENSAARDEEEGMHKRRITLADGRYLIFYTFTDEGDAQAAESVESARPEPAAPEPVAEEERRV